MPTNYNTSGLGALYYTLFTYTRQTLSYAIKHLSYSFFTVAPITWNLSQIFVAGRLFITYILCMYICSEYQSKRCISMRGPDYAITMDIVPTNLQITAYPKSRAITFFLALTNDISKKISRMRDFERRQT